MVLHAGCELRHPHLQTLAAATGGKHGGQRGVATHAVQEEGHQDALPRHAHLHQLLDAPPYLRPPVQTAALAAGTGPGYSPLLPAGLHACLLVSFGGSFLRVSVQPPLCEPLWPSDKGARLVSRRTSVRSASALLSLQILWFMDTVL